MRNYCNKQGTWWTNNLFSEAPWSKAHSLDCYTRRVRRRLEASTAMYILVGLTKQSTDIMRANVWRSSSSAWDIYNKVVCVCLENPCGFIHQLDHKPWGSPGAMLVPILRSVLKLGVSAPIAIPWLPLITDGDWLRCSGCQLAGYSPGPSPSQVWSHTSSFWEKG